MTATLAASGAATYEVVVTKLGSTVSVYAQTGITTTSHRIDIPLRNGVHEIQVRAIRAENGQLYAGALQRTAYGYRDRDYFIAKLYALHLAKFELIG